MRPNQIQMSKVHIWGVFVSLKNQFSLCFVSLPHAVLGCNLGYVHKCFCNLWYFCLEICGCKGHVNWLMPSSSPDSIVLCHISFFPYSV